MMTNQYIYIEFQTGDVSRLGALVISGIGFLGAGTILVTRSNQIRGLNTAAGLWSSACIGLAVGIGFYEGALSVGIVLVLIMTVFRKVDHYVQNRSRYIKIYIGFSSGGAMNHFMEYCKEGNIKVIDIQLSKPKGNIEGEVIAFLTIKNPKKLEHAAIIVDFAKLDGVSHIEEV